MNRKLLLGIAVVAVGASLLSTGAFVDVPNDEIENIEMTPSDGPNSIYAVNNTGEIKLDLSEDNQKLHENATGVNENSITEIKNIFTVTYTGNGEELPDRHVWFETEHDDVEFVRGTNSVESIQGNDSSYELKQGEMIHIGIVVDTTGEHSVEDVEEFTIHVEELNTGSDEEAGSATPAPGDDETEDETDDTDGGTGGTDEPGDGATDDSESEADEQESGADAAAGAEETEDNTTEEEGLVETDEGAGGQTLEAPGTTPGFTDTQQTLGSTFANTLLLLLIAILLGAGLFALVRYGLQSSQAS